eukprot:GHVR01145367.1.p1 GENE.GHVR01145367.1~~GHVR01145367.1.p1  ORF type:complete len:102 (-),score=15.88 GHVR01145367.1:81-386(-)
MEKCRTGQLNLPKNMFGAARDLVKMLLRDDDNARPNCSQIKAHDFFKSIAWAELQRKELDPPYVPRDDDPSPVYVEEKDSKVSAYSSKKYSALGDTGGSTL